jgi:hypothetical protein
MQELSQILGNEDIDLVVLEEAKPALKFLIFKSGVILFEATPGLVEDFLVKALSEYYDNRIFLESQFLAAQAYLDRVTMHE